MNNLDLVRNKGEGSINIGRQKDIRTNMKVKSKLDCHAWNLFHKLAQHMNLFYLTRSRRHITYRT